MPEFEQVVVGYHFFRFQTDVPPDGNLENFKTELCSEKVYYGTVNGQPNYSDLKGKIPNTISIIPIKTPIELESKYPGLTEAAKLMQRALIAEGLEYLNPPPILEEASPQILDEAFENQEATNESPEAPQ